jgi:hypothetical protein
MVPVDLRGQTYGRLTVVGRGPNDAGGNLRWSCRCECGEVTAVRAANLTNGNTRSCGCLRRRSPSMVNDVTDRVGEVHYQLTVTARAEGGWVCLCSCGQTVTVHADRLGRSKSCGCLQEKWGYKPNARYTRRAKGSLYDWNKYNAE